MTPLAFARPAGQRGRLYSDMENGGLLHYKGYTARPEYSAFCAETGKLPEQQHIGTKMITVPELEANAEEYVEMAQAQDILIAEHGKVVAKLTAVEQQRA